MSLSLFIAFHFYTIVHLKFSFCILLDYFSFANLTY